MNTVRALCKWAMDNETDYVYAGFASSWGKVVYCSETDFVFLKSTDPAGLDTMQAAGYYVGWYDGAQVEVPDVPTALTDGDTWPVVSALEYIWRTGQAADADQGGLTETVSNYELVGFDVERREVVFQANLTTPDRFVDSGGHVDVRGTVQQNVIPMHFVSVPTLP